jgi:DNA-binding NarL/FixJ family response regulator
MTIRLVAADNHPLILDGLENLFRQEEDFLLAARCSNGDEALEAARQHRPDVLVLETRLPKKGGLAVAGKLRSDGLSTRIVFFTAEIDEYQLLETIRLGIQGIVLKAMAPQLLVRCIRKVHNGGQWLERDSTQQAVEKMLQREAGARAMKGLLTVREIELVRLIARGLPNKEIAGQLFIGEGTVKTHLHNIFEKLGVNNRLALLRFAQDKNLV